MSLVSTWAPCDDGLYHKNPILSDRPDGHWFICFDDDDPPELVAVGVWSLRALYKLLDAHDIKAVIGELSTCGRTCLPFEHGKLQIVGSTSAFLTFHAEPPAALVVAEDSSPCRREKIQGDCVIEAVRPLLSEDYVKSVKEGGERDEGYEEQQDRKAHILELPEGMDDDGYTCYDPRTDVRYMQCECCGMICELEEYHSAGECNFCHAINKDD